MPSADILVCDQFLGRLMGIAMRTNILMPLDLPSAFWRPLVGLPLTRQDLEGEGVETLCYAHTEPYGASRSLVSVVDSSRKGFDC